MARKPRVHFPGAVYHVLLRSSEGQVFRDESDCETFCELLREGVERFDHRVHAFCLMPDHVHLAVQVGQMPLSRAMQNLGFRYTRWFNNRYDRSGRLFRDRYKAILVERDAYLLDLVRYIHLNPMRTKLVRVPIDYPWSSHRAYCGKQQLPWLSTDLVLTQFDPHERLAMNRFQRFMVDGLGEQDRDDLQRGGEHDRRLLGDEQFVAKALEPAPTREGRADARAVLDLILQAYGLTDRQLRNPGKSRYPSEARGVAALVVFEDGYGSLVELGRLLNRDATTLSSAIRRTQQKLAKDPALAQKVAELRERAARLQG